MDADEKRMLLVFRHRGPLREGKITIGVARQHGRETGACAGASPRAARRRGSDLFPSPRRTSRRNPGRRVPDRAPPRAAPRRMLRRRAVAQSAAAAARARGKQTNETASSSQTEPRQKAAQHRSLLLVRPSSAVSSSRARAIGNESPSRRFAPARTLRSSRVLNFSSRYSSSAECDGSRARSLFGRRQTADAPGVERHLHRRVQRGFRIVIALQQFFHQRGRARRAADRADSRRASLRPPR